MDNEQLNYDIDNNNSEAVDNLATELPKEQVHLVLRTENLVKKYGKRTVVSHVSIVV